MGSSFSSNGMQPLETRQNGQTNVEPINIRFTKDVLNRWKTIAIASAITEISANECKYQYGSKVGVECQQSEQSQNQYDETSSTTCTENPLDYKSFSTTMQNGKEFNFETSSESLKEDFNKLESDFAREDMKTKEPIDQFGDFEQRLKAAKESLRRMTDALGQDKIVVGVGIDGRPTVETISTWKVREEKEKELRKNDMFWSDKLESIKNEFVKSVDEDLDAFLQKTDKIQEFHPPPKKNLCIPFYSKVANCYAENRNQVLNCRSVVKEFSKCVQSNFQSLK